MRPKSIDTFIRAAVLALLLPGAAALPMRALAADVPATDVPATDAPATAVPATVAPAADAPALDAARMWDEFLAKADYEAVDPALGLVFDLGYTGRAVDPALCATHAGPLEAAVVTVPVSLALRRASYLCAVARGDDAIAEREVGAMAALSRHALKLASSANGAPAPILWPSDAYALLQASGLEFRYEYYTQFRPQRHFPLVVVGWDAERKVERHLRFDYVDPQYRIHRKGKLVGYPRLRQVIVDNFIEGGSKGGMQAAVDVQGLRHASGEDGTGDRLAKLRAVAMDGGVRSARRWLANCAQASADACEGLVDALLEQAEGGRALPMVLLAVAYHDGVGTKADPDTAWQLVDRAQKHWSDALAEFASVWIDIHEGEALPPVLQQRLEAAVREGNRAARRVLITRTLETDAPTLTQEEQDFLAQASENGLGWGYAHLGWYFDKRKDNAKAWSWKTRAAEAGNPWAQDKLASALIYGDDEVPADMARGLRMAEAAAHGGEDWSARQMGYRRRLAGDFAAAETWLLGGAANSDVDAMFALADLWEEKRPGVESGPERAVQFYQRLIDTEAGPEARRRLAAMAMAGRGMDKDPAKAEDWLRTDAERDDAESQMILGALYLSGDLGKVERRQGQRWLERAMKAGYAPAFDAWATWLYYSGGDTPAVRQEAMAVFAKAFDAGNEEVLNNYAWALCTSADPQVFDAARGKRVAERMGPVDALSPGTQDTVAACHAANGDFATALTLQERAAKAMAALESEESRAKAAAKPPGYMRRMALYRDGKRFEETVREE
jgi:TPR repeat protein